MPPTNTPLEIDMESAIRAALSKIKARHMHRFAQ